MYTSVAFTDTIVLCPYNKSHLIARSRIQKHIVKCEKNYPEGYKVMCPYNATHRLFKHEMEEHIISCTDRHISEPGVYQGGPREHRAASVALHSQISSTIDCQENWDVESNDDWKFFMDDEQSLGNDSKLFHEHLDTSVQKESLNDKYIRPPRGFSEAMLRDADGDSCVEDIESVISAMGIGRGKAGVKNDNVAKVIGLGRGKPLNG